MILCFLIIRKNWISDSLSANSGLFVKNKAISNFSDEEFEKILTNLFKVFSIKVTLSLKLSSDT